MTSPSQEEVSVDDRDPQLTYSPEDAWSHSGKSGAEFKGTTTITKAANATVVFNFYGTGITVFGSVSSSTNSSLSSTIPPQSEYTIDGGTSVTYTPPLIDQPQRAVPFFSNTSLALANHTLVITTLAPGGFFCLDRITLSPGGIPLAPSFSVNNQSSVAESESTTPSAKISAGTIAGAVLGILSLVLIAAIIFVTFKYYRRRYGRRKPEIHIYRDSRNSTLPPKYIYNV